MSAVNRSASTTTATRERLRIAEDELRRLRVSKEVSASNSRLRYLEADYKARSRQRTHEIHQLVIQGSSLDLCFLIDCTASMQGFIEMVKGRVVQIADQIKQDFPKLELHVAFIGYRDYDDAQQTEVCAFLDFSTSRADFEKFVSCIKASGGDDAAEDVFSGLQAAGVLNWQSANRVLVHIADSPCHGSEFHEDVNDSHKSGDKLGRDVADLVSKLKLLCNINCYLFCHLTTCTHKMIQRFRELAGLLNSAWIQELTDATLANIPDKIVVVAKKSLSATISGGVKPRRSVAVPVSQGKPDWDQMPSVEGNVYHYNILSITKMLEQIKEGKALDVEELGEATLKIAPTPFSAEGVIRWPFYAKLLQGPPFMADDAFDSEAAEKFFPIQSVVDFVVKRFKDPVIEPGKSYQPAVFHSKKKYDSQMEVQAVAGALAIEFNRISREKGLKEIRFALSTIFAAASQTEDKLYCMEKELQGRWTRYLNNYGYINKEELEHAASVHAFSHWTHSRTNGLLLVTDLQGVKEEAQGRTTYWLSDPAIHCQHDILRFTKTNLGAKGVENFFKLHQCNDACHALGLEAAQAADVTRLSLDSWTELD